MLLTCGPEMPKLRQKYNSSFGNALTLASELKKFQVQEVLILILPVIYVICLLSQLPMLYETIVSRRMFRGTWESVMQGRISLGPRC